MFFETSDKYFLIGSCFKFFLFQINHGGSTKTELLKRKMKSHSARDSIKFISNLTSFLSRLRFLTFSGVNAWLCFESTYF